MQQDHDAAALGEGSGAVPMPAFLPPKLQFPLPRRNDPFPGEQLTGTPAEATEHERIADGDFVVAAPDRGQTDGSSPASTGKKFRPLATAEQVKAAKQLVGAMLMGATGLLNKRVALHDADRRWLMTTEQRDSIAAPLARILARRSPVQLDGENASDVADGIEAVAAILAFSIEQMQADPDQDVRVVQGQAVQQQPAAAPAQPQPVAHVQPVPPHAVAVDANPFAAMYGQGYPPPGA